MSTIPFNAAVPLYHQIAQELRLRLRDKRLSGGRFPTEAELCAEFGVSRTAVRQALAILKSEGLLESRRGGGTRVMAVQSTPRVVRATGDPLHANLDTHPRIVVFGLCAAPPEVAAYFGLQPEAPVFRVMRVHELDGAPLSIVDSYLVADVGTRLQRSWLVTNTLHDLLWSKAQIRQARSVHRICVRRANAQIASLLNVALADPVLHVQSSVYDPHGRPVRWTENFFREDRYEYTAEMQWKAPAAAGKTTNPRRKTRS